MPPELASVVHLRNKNNAIVEKNQIKAGEVDITFDISKFKSNNGQYNLKVYAIDQNKGQTVNKTVTFKIPTIQATNVSSNKTVNSNVLILGHRGYFKNINSIVQNSKKAFDKAIEVGCDGLECDVRVTKDGVLVISHDNSIDKMVNGKRDNISSLNWSQLERLYLSNDGKTKCGKFMKFEDFAKEYFANKNLTLDIEIKSNNIEKKVMNIVKKYKKHDNIIITSFNAKILSNIREIDSNIKVGLILKKNEAVTESTINNCKRLKINALVPRYNNISKSKVDLIHSNKLSVYIWGANNLKDIKQLYNYKVDGIITDNSKEVKKSI